MISKSLQILIPNSYLIFVNIPAHKNLLLDIELSSMILILVSWNKNDNLGGQNLKISKQPILQIDQFSLLKFLMNILLLIYFINCFRRLTVHSENSSGSDCLARPVYIACN